MAASGYDLNKLRSDLFFSNSSSVSRFQSGRTIANALANNRGILSTNAGIANDAYFNNFSSRINGGRGLADVLQTKNLKNEAPIPFRADSLWTNSRSSKGMFVQSDFLTSTDVAIVDDEESESLQTARSLDTGQKYGFQFHYNPTTIDMAYQGLADIDYTMFTSGREAFNLLGTQATQSTISFNLVLNRLLDRRYFDPDTERLRPDVRPTDWAGRFPRTIIEEKEMYRKGTMYDIEFFLRTVMQVPISAYLKERNSLFLAGSRGSQTADVGFLTGVPVELHLGKSLRYLVRVDSFSLKHIMFSEDMVPLFTEVAIQCSRIPDYAASATAGGQTTYDAAEKNKVDPLTEAEAAEQGDSMAGLSEREQAILDEAAGG